MQGAAPYGATPLPITAQRRQLSVFFQELALPAGGLLFVHSAFRELSRAGFEPEPVLDALVEHMSSGTLLFPAMSWRTVTPDNPTFDARNTPGITGLLAERFRTGYATERSLHPTHSVAGRGRLAAEILGRHHRSSTPCDDDSPFGLLAKYGGDVLLLGVEMDSCTLVHHLEERFNPDRYLQPETETYRCVRFDQSVVDVRTRRHRKLMRNFWQFGDLLAERGGVRQARLACVLGTAFSASAMAAVIAERLAEDPDGTLARPGERAKWM